MAVMCRGVEVISKTQILAWGAGKHAGHVLFFSYLQGLKDQTDLSTDRCEYKKKKDLV